MPHRLLPGRPISEHIGPYADSFDKIQDAFGNTNYSRCPIDNEFLMYFVGQLKLIFASVTRDVSYSTRDGRVWTAINFLYDGHWYKLLLPRHEGKSNTGLVSLYCKRDPALYEDAIDDEIKEVCQALVSQFLTARSEFYASKRR